MSQPNGTPAQDSPEAWVAYQLASAIRSLADAVREGLLALARAIKEQHPNPKGGTR